MPHEQRVLIAPRRAKKLARRIQKCQQQQPPSETEIEPVSYSPVGARVLNTRACNCTESAPWKGYACTHAQVSVYVDAFVRESRFHNDDLRRTESQLSALLGVSASLDDYVSMVSMISNAPRGETTLTVPIQDTATRTNFQRNLAIRSRGI